MMRIMSNSIKKSLYSRQRVLLALVQAFGGKLSSMDLQKYLFLYTKKYQKVRSYEFIPYKYGCFSFQSYADRRRLIDVGAIKSTDTWELDEQIDYLSQISLEDRKNILIFKHQYIGIKGEHLVRDVYRQYPYYAIKSEIAVKLMNENELKKIEQAKPCQVDSVFFTIGYEGNSFDNYLNRLIENNIHVLCDVRKNPLSRKYGFSKKILSETLSKINIEYVHIPNLGIVSEKRQILNSQSDYDRLFDEYEKSTLKENIEDLQKLYGIFQVHQRVAISCFEAEYYMCHRSRIAKALTKMPEWEYSISHI